MRNEARSLRSAGAMGIRVRWWTWSVQQPFLTSTGTYLRSFPLDMA
jgi:hypothetical protein